MTKIKHRLCGQKILSKLVLFALLILIGVANSNAQNLLTNGDFEAAASTPLYSFPAINPTAIPGWTTINDGNGGCDITLYGTGQGMGIPQGTKAVDLQNKSNASGNLGCQLTATVGGAIEQTVTLTIGSAYKLKYYKGSLTSQVKLNGTVIKSNSATAGYDSVIFTATVASNTIRFRNTSSAGAVSILDDVSLVLAVEIAANGTDDDGDGLIDCADPDLALNAACAACPYPGDSSANWKYLTPESGFTKALAIKYTGSDQSFTVPAGVTSVKVKAWGAGGCLTTGGGGAAISGSLAVTPGESISLIVGAGGLVSASTHGARYGGGGAAPLGSNGNYHSGAGRSAIRRGNTELATAGGGGSAGTAMCTNSRAGDGGAATGGVPSCFTCASYSCSTLPGGGTASAGGAAGTNSSISGACNGTAGSQYQGGQAGRGYSYNGSYTANNGGGGGGGGYYGGGGGAGHWDNNLSGGPYQDDAGGGGGSSYIGGLTSASATAGSNGLAGLNGDVHYIAGTGRAGFISNSGGHGLIVLQWNDPVGCPEICSNGMDDDFDGLVDEGCNNTNPDINATFAGVPVAGSLKTNDTVASGTTYGTATALAGNPSACAPTITAATGAYTFTCTTPGTYNYNVPVCPTGVTPPACPVELLTITVVDSASGTNPPVANTDATTTLQNTPVTLNVLANDRPGSIGDSLLPSSLMVLGTPSNGTTSVNPTTGEITYTPNTGFVGTDTVRYKVCDNQSPQQCDTAIMIVDILPTGSPNSTSAADDYAATKGHTAATGNVKTNDKDPQGNTQTVTAQTTNIPGKGTLVLLANGTYTFTPVTGYVGPVEFPYTVCDNGSPAACKMATLHILVYPCKPEGTPVVNCQ